MHYVNARSHHDQIKFSKNMQLEADTVNEAASNKPFNINILSPSDRLLQGISPPPQDEFKQYQQRPVAPHQYHQQRQQQPLQAAHRHQQNQVNGDELHRPLRPKTARARKPPRRSPQYNIHGAHSKKHENLSNNMPPLSPILGNSGVSYENQANHNGNHNANPITKPHYKTYSSKLALDAHQPANSSHSIASNRSSREIILDPTDKAKARWQANGGSETGKLSLNEFLGDFYNHLMEKTGNQSLAVDMQSMKPFFQSFAGRSGSLQVDKRTFCQVWNWFDSLCDIVNETKQFWNQPIASYHGFISRENADRNLRSSQAGTFIVRFTAPQPNLEILYHEKYGAKIQTVQLIRKGADLYSMPQTPLSSKLFMWIQFSQEMLYVYSSATPPVLEDKNKYFSMH